MMNLCTRAAVDAFVRFAARPAAVDYFTFEKTFADAVRAAGFATRTGKIRPDFFAAAFIERFDEFETEEIAARLFALGNAAFVDGERETSARLFDYAAAMYRAAARAANDYELHAYARAAIDNAETARNFEML